MADLAWLGLLGNQIDVAAFVRLVERHPADAALRRELLDLAPGTTEDEPLS